jgi:hypothetical protein
LKLDQGQGGAMAIEDAAALGVLLSGLKSKDVIAERLQQFEQLRVKRVAAMVIFSSVGQDEAHKIKEIVRPFVDGPLPSEWHFPDLAMLADGGRLTAPAGCPADYHVYNFTPNVLRDAMELLESDQGSTKP